MGRGPQVIARYSSIVQFFKSLMCVLQSMRIERDHRALLVSQKVSLTTYGEDSPGHKYLDMLTPYAFNFIKGQLEKRHIVSYRTALQAYLHCAHIRRPSAVRVRSGGTPLDKKLLPAEPQSLPD